MEIQEIQQPQIAHSTSPSWIDSRLGLSDLKKIADKKEVPVYRHTLWYYLGGMTLFLFAIQVVTGILLLLYYRPSAEEAFESVQFITADVSFGWLVRSLHSWSANLMVLTLMVHMFSVYLLKAYRKPREVTWLTGMLLMFVVLGFGFSGYLLPWNTLSFFATRVGTQMAGVVPVIGDWLVNFLRGGDDVTGATLTRFFGFHVAVLPAVTTAILGVHLLLVQKHGMSVSPGWKSRNGRTMKFVPSFLMRDLVGWLFALGILAALAAVFPWELGVKADPFAPAPAGIRPEWFFVAAFQTLKFLPAKILSMEGEALGIMLFGLGALYFVFVPFIDRDPLDRGRSRLCTFLGIAAIIYFITLTIVGYMN